jgi:MFS family permease
VPPGPLRGRVGLRIRVLVTAFFVLDGLVFANWIVRVPDIKAQVGASTGSLGLALLGVSAGAVLTMTVTGRLCRRFGAERMSVVMGLTLSLAVMLPALARSVPILAAALFAFGVGYGGLNVAMNSVAVDVIAQIGGPVMPGFHAAYSLGGLLGALAGGALASALSPAWHLTLVGLLGLVMTGWLGPGLLRPRRDIRHDDVVVAEPPGSSIQPVVLLFGVIALCTAYGEGALADWAALHLRDDLHTSAGMAAAGYASFSVAMFAGRLSGTWTTTRLGQTRLVAIGGITAGGGMLVAALAPTLPLTVAGFVLVGLGLANVFPTAVAEAGALGGAQGVAVASTIGYCGFLVGPPLIGFLADSTSLPIALTSIAVLAGGAAAAALLADRVAAVNRARLAAEGCSSPN